MNIAYLCVFMAGFLPYVAAGIAKSKGFSPHDNHNPREFLARQEGFHKRANWAQANSFEAFPLFAAGVLIAVQRDASSTTVDMLAIAFIVARILYLAAYLGDWATGRSLFWLAGIGSASALFFV